MSILVKIRKRQPGSKHKFSLFTVIVTIYGNIKLPVFCWSSSSSTRGLPNAVKRRSLWTFSQYSE